MRAKTRKSPLRGTCASAREKKVTFPGGDMRFYDFDMFSGKKPAGTSFHVLVMQAHARTGAHTVPDVEEMLHKVRWGLREVSL